MKKVPEKLINKKVFLLDMGTLVAGTKYRGEFESRMKSILEEATDPTNNIILFIDELHTIIGAGGQDQNDAAQMLKPLLSRGKIKLIGATTFDEYQKYIEKDAALKRRFQEVVVNEPSVEVTKQIILGLKQIYEDFHGVLLSDEAIDSAINLSKRYILNKQLPDKALDIIDEACARKSTMQQKLDNDENYQAQEKKIEKIFKGKVLDVEVHTVTLPNGETSKRELINHRGAVAILALTKDDEVVLVEQYRKAIEAVTLEIPAGKLEPGEDNKKLSAIRELREETGYVVEEERLEKLCDVHVALGYSSELITIYYVDNLEYAGEIDPDDDEFINLRKYKIEEAFKLLDDNVITDSKTMLALAYLKNRKGAK